MLRTSTPCPEHRWRRGASIPTGKQRPDRQGTRLFTRSPEMRRLRPWSFAWRRSQRCSPGHARPLKAECWSSAIRCAWGRCVLRNGVEASSRLQSPSGCLGLSRHMDADMVASPDSACDRWWRRTMRPRSSLEIDDYATSERRYQAPPRRATAAKTQKAGLAVIRRPFAFMRRVQHAPAAWRSGRGGRTSRRRSLPGRGRA